MTQSFYNRHNILLSFLESLDGCKVHPADGTYYLFPNVTGIIARLGLEDDIALAEYILEKACVSVIPGSVFGMPGYLRISFVVSEEKLHLAIERIQRLLLSSEQ